MFENSLVIFGTLSLGVCDFSCSLFCNPIPGTDCDDSFQALSLISLMTLEIASPLAAFHRSHSEGWNILGSSVVSLIISGDLFWSG